MNISKIFLTGLLITLSSQSFGASIEANNSVVIQASEEAVFNYVTNPTKWVTWHPATISVTGSPDRPATLNEKIVELIHIPNGQTELHWLVTTSLPPYQWVIEGSGNIGKFRITYDFGGGLSRTVFQRHVEFEPATPLDNARLEAAKRALYLQSEQALQNIKNLLE